MRCRELHGVRATRSLPNIFAPLVELVDNVAGNRHQLAARIRQADRLAVATEQRYSDPFLKQANAPAEGRLRNISPGRGARKAARFCQCQKNLRAMLFALSKYSLVPIVIRFGLGLSDLNCIIAIIFMHK